uniref:Methyltransferase FkbM domain-containing protein n=1 Tax=Rheinheimera sp. BAL341 TaxID=1708203 RepID=A0A486XY10_9GAMM
MNSIDNLKYEEKIQLLESLLKDEAVSNSLFGNSAVAKEIGLEKVLKLKSISKSELGEHLFFNDSTFQKEFASDIESLNRFLTRQDVKSAIANNKDCIKGLVTISDFIDELSSIEWFLKRLSKNQQLINLVIADIPTNKLLVEKILTDSRIKNTIKVKEGYLEGLVQGVSQRIANLSTIKNHLKLDDSWVSYLVNNNDFMKSLLERKVVKSYIASDSEYLEQLSLEPELANNLLKIKNFSNSLLSESDSFNLFISTSSILNNFFGHLSRTVTNNSVQSLMFLQTVSNMRDFSNLLKQVSEYLTIPEENSEKVTLSYKKIANGSNDFQNLLAMIFESNNEVTINGKPFRIIDWRGFWIPFQEIFLNKDYDLAIESEKPFFVDAGANIGLATVYLKCKHPNAEVICFEPSQAIREVLELNVEMQGLSNVRVMPYALSSKSGMFEFTVPDKDNLSGSLRTNIESHGVKKEVVEVKRLAPFINKKCDFIKLDIEGAEFAVLNDIKKNLNTVSNIFIEYHGEANGTPSDLVKIVSMLVSQGFRLNISKAFGTDKYTKISPFSHLNKRYSQVIYATRDIEKPHHKYQKLKSFFNV